MNLKSWIVGSSQFTVLIALMSSIHVALTWIFNQINARLVLETYDLETLLNSPKIKWRLKNNINNLKCFRIGAGVQDKNRTHTYATFNTVKLVQHKISWLVIYFCSSHMDIYFNFVYSKNYVEIKI